MADFGHFSTIFGQEIGKIQKIALSPGARPGVATICGLLAYKRDSAAGPKLPYAKFKICQFWPKSSKNGPFSLKLGDFWFSFSLKSENFS